MEFTIDCEQEDDGRWLAEVLELPGVLVYGQTIEQAIARAKALALRVVADRLEHGETTPDVWKNKSRAKFCSTPVQLHLN